MTRFAAILVLLALCLSAYGSPQQETMMHKVWVVRRAAVVMIPGLVGYWKFDEGSGSTAIDSSTSGYNGSLTNSPIYTNSVPSLPNNAYSLKFNGVNQWATMGNILNQGTNNYSISLWFWAANANQNCGLVTKRNDASGYQSYSININSIDSAGNPSASKKITFFTYDGSGVLTDATCQNYRTTADVLDGAWHHVVVVRSSGVVKIYVDKTDAPLTKVLGGSNNVNGDTTKPFAVGSAPGANYFSGLVDDLRVYNRAITSNEVVIIYGGSL